MTREKLKEIQPILNAFAEGKVIQVRDPSGNWQDRVHSLKLSTLIEHPEWYRIKPEPKYRPFANVEECWQEMLKHQPFGWVKYNECYFSIVHIDDNHVVLADKDVCSILLASEHSCKDLTFADGTPFGIKEEH